jgi:hypothetical protein
MHVEVGSRYPTDMSPYTEEDLAYLRRELVPLEVLCERTGRDPKAVFPLIAHRQLPLPTYVTPDGTAWVPGDYFSLLDEAGSPERIHALFARRLRAEAERMGETVPDAELEVHWSGYITGGFGACLREVTPEHVLQKERLVARLTAQLAAPAPEEPGWCALLRQRVEALDALERPFAPYDRLRYGGPVSRDRLITAPRECYPAIFAAACATAPDPLTSAG